MAGVGASYYDGSACHLDLVQWATDPVWGKLSPEIKQALIENDAEFLLAQLANEKIQLLLLNGKGVIDSFQEATGTSLKNLLKIPTKRASTCIFTGTMRSGVFVIGWSTNLQSSFGVTNELRGSIAKHVAELAGVGSGVSKS